MDRPNRPRRFAPAALALALALAALSGCKRDRNDPDVIDFPGAFYWDALLDDYTAVEERTWDTFQERAVVEFEAWDFDGEIVLEIYDDEGILIFEEVYTGSGGHLFAIDETDRGEDGEWLIVISSFDTDGFVEIEVF